MGESTARHVDVMAGFAGFAGRFTLLAGKRSLPGRPRGQGLWLLNRVQVACIPALCHQQIPVPGLGRPTGYQAW